MFNNYRLAPTTDTNLYLQRFKHLYLTLCLTKITYTRYPTPLLRLAPVHSAGVGVVLHQPLKRQIFVKNGNFDENMNGVPVWSGQKSENAPTQGPRKANFRGPVLGLFCRFLLLPYSPPAPALHLFELE